ncbi:MAG: hypothetical protein ACFCUH_12600 [Flavobacteriales bacterium]
MVSFRFLNKVQLEALWVCSLLIAIPQFVLGQELLIDRNSPITPSLSGIRAAAYDAESNVVYLGGEFIYLGAPRNRLGAYHLDGSFDADYARTSSNEDITHIVQAMCEDGSGGVIVGASNEMFVDGIPQGRVIRIDSDGNIMDWSVPVQGPVQELYRTGDTLFVDAILTSPHTGELQRISAVNLQSGEVYDWSCPNYNNSAGIWLSSNDTALFVGGSFTNIEGVPRNGLAAFSLTTGELLAWNPGLNSYVEYLEVRDDLLFVGGDFTSIGGVIRNGVCAIDIASALPTSWNPNANNSVRSMAFTDSTVYLGGKFTNLNGVIARGLAEVSLVTGERIGPDISVTGTFWSFTIPTSVGAIALHGDTVFFGGNFKSVQSYTRHALAAVSRSTGELLEWHRAADRDVTEFAMANDRLVVGGYFSLLNGTRLNRAAALDLSTNTLLDWAPNVRFNVLAVALTDDAVYFGGEGAASFGSSSNLCAFDRITGEPLENCPEISDPVYALATDGINVYVGGEFTQMGGVQRNRIGRFSIETGEVSSWNPNANGTVNALAIHNGLVYLVGEFTNIGSQSRNRAASVSLDNGLVTNWAPSLNNTAHCITPTEQGVYIGGAFTSVNGQVRQYAVRVDANSGAASNWNPLPNASVRGIGLQNGRVYMAGEFTQVFGMPRASLVEVNMVTGIPTAWSPVFVGLSYGIEPVSDGLLMLGSNGVVSDHYSRGLTRFAWCTMPDLPTFAADTVPGCLGQSVELSINSGNLNDAAEWHWYANGCGVDYLGTGSSILVSPTETTTYYVRGQGNCTYGGDCAAITVSIPEASIDEQVACGSFEWIDGNTYNESTTAPSYLLEGATQNGCDSLVVLHLTIVGAFDDCGDCYDEGENDPSWNTSCLDCTGIVNGDAFIDPCGECVGGNTGLEACDPCIADFSSDGYVSILDLSALLQDLGCISDCSADVTGDGVVNIDDLLLMLQLFGQYCN